MCFCVFKGVKTCLEIGKVYLHVATSNQLQVTSYKSKIGSFNWLFVSCKKQLLVLYTRSNYLETICLCVEIETEYDYVQQSKVADNYLNVLNNLTVNILSGTTNGNVKMGIAIIPTGFISHKTI